MYNHNHNPIAERNQKILGINYTSSKDKNTIHQHLGKKLAYDEHTLYGFALPGAVFSVLEQQAQAANCTCSELLQKILERTYTKEIARQIHLREDAQTNLISVKEYGKLNKRSQEQAKQYLHQDRVPGAARIGRDWVIPRDSRFPENHRRKGSK